MVVAETTALRRMENLEPSQESIETVSLWVTHHKDSHETICTAWMKAFNEASDKLKLALFYLANDVIQKSKHHQCDGLKMGLLENVKDAIKVIRNDVSMMTKVNRVVNIWHERQVFDSNIIKMLKSVARGEKIADGEPKTPPPKPSPNNENDDFGEGSPDYEKALLDFDPTSLVSSLERNLRAEAMIERARLLLTSADLNLQAKVKASLKDRETGQQVLAEVDGMCARMTEFVCALEAAVQQHQKMLTTLDHGRAFFGQQLRDATVVEEAYRKFGQGIANVKDQVEEMQRTGVYPAATPPRDAPSPSDNDDPFDQGVEMAIKELKKPGNRDLIEVHAMELDEDDTSAGTIQTNESFMNNPAMMDALKSQPPADPRLSRNAKSRAPTEEDQDWRSRAPTSVTSAMNVSVPPPPLPLINTSQPPPMPPTSTAMYSPTIPPPMPPMISPTGHPPPYPQMPPPFAAGMPPGMPPQFSSAPPTSPTSSTAQSVPHGAPGAHVFGAPPRHHAAPQPHRHHTNGNNNNNRHHNNRRH